MSKGASPAIGTVPCPWASCKEVAEVKKFQHRATRDTQRRYAGKLFAVCPVHGRFGAEGSEAFQEYILEHATIWGEEKHAPAGEPAPTIESKPPAAKAPVKLPPASLPAPTPKPTPAPTQEPKPKSAGWGGFFE